MSASASIAQRANEPLSELAAALGYFDQAHLARDFTQLFGCPPWNTSEANSPDASAIPGARGAMARLINRMDWARLPHSRSHMLDCQARSLPHARSGWG